MADLNALADVAGSDIPNTHPPIKIVIYLRGAITDLRAGSNAMSLPIYHIGPLEDLYFSPFNKAA